MKHLLNWRNVASGAWRSVRIRGVAAYVPSLSVGASSRGGIGFYRPSLLMTCLAFVAAIALPMLLLGALALSLHGDAAGGMALAGSKLLFAEGAVATPPARTPANIRQAEAEFKKLARELEIGQNELAAGPVSQKRGEELEGMAKEMESLQSYIDQYNRVAGMAKKGREVESPTMPTDRNGNEKSIRTTRGQLYVASEAFRTYRQQGKQGWSAYVPMQSLKDRTVTLRGEDAVKFQAKAFDAATLSDLGTDAIIEVDRDREIIRFEEPEILTIREVLGRSNTTADTIRFVRHVATERAAQSQATRGALKTFLRVEFEPTETPVQTIAVLSKVTEQDIDDAPRLVGFINGEMTLDVKVEEERQLVYGTGVGGQLKGLFHADYAIPEFDRAAAEDTIIDVIRKMRTDLRLQRVQPNFVAIDPLDWEEVELAKGSDDRYIWGLITDLRGPRIWSLRVVESDAMTNADTGERRLLMGDGIRGATVYDRHDVRLAIGYMDDDFGRNLRTLRAEERLALAVKRSFAFEYAVTQAGS
jgi:HK97 family phage major capsid protein